ncbi:MAG: peptide chain release factor N(5)-glutamine methyltransferase [Alphaproteobacteria bacterium]
MILEKIYKELCDVMPEHDARYVIEKRTGLSHAAMIANPGQEIDETAIMADLAQYKRGIPLSRIYEEREFWGMNFRLSPATLDPRPDTETLIEAVVKRCKDNPPARILDLGTGTGCILIALLSEFPQATGVGIDLSEEAVQTAKYNAQQNHVAARAEFLQGNWAESINESFDLVVSNPPYIARKVIQNLDESVKNHDPILALEGGEDGLQAYKEIFSQLFHILKPGGRAFFEIGFDQEESTTRLSEESRFSVISTYADLAGHVRVLEVVAGKPNGDK